MKAKAALTQRTKEQQQGQDEQQGSWTLLVPLLDLNPHSLPSRGCWFDWDFSKHQESSACVCNRTWTTPRHSDAMPYMWIPPSRLRGAFRVFGPKPGMIFGPNHGPWTRLGSASEPVFFTRSGGLRRSPRSAPNPILSTWALVHRRLGSTDGWVDRRD